MANSELALLGGPKAVQTDPEDMFTWPIITEEDEQAVLEVLRRGGMSGTDVTQEFERDFADWHGVEYAVGHSSGTAALQAAMWACGVGVGDEVIGPSLTYWASVLPAFSLGAGIVFGEVDPMTLCLDPNDLENRITERTKAIIPVHYCGYPCDMDAIMEIAEKHDIKVIEDVSHAHGAHYKGRLVGTIGHCAGFSVMSGKALAVGEGGMFITNDELLHERVIAWGHYGRTTLWAHQRSLPGSVAEALRGPPLGRLQVPDAPVVLRLRPRAAQALQGPLRGDPEGHELFLGPAGGRAWRARSPAAQGVRLRLWRMVCLPRHLCS